MIESPPHRCHLASRVPTSATLLSPPLEDVAVSKIVRDSLPRARTFSFYQNIYKRLFVWKYEVRMDGWSDGFCNYVWT